LPASRAPATAMPNKASNHNAARISAPRRRRGQRRQRVVNAWQFDLLAVSQHLTQGRLGSLPAARADVEIALQITLHLGQVLARCFVMAREQGNRALSRRSLRFSRKK